MLKEFREFAIKGNVVDMAVGIIIGGAFGGIVKSMVEDMIMPPIGLMLGKVDFSNLFIVLKPGSSPVETLGQAKAVGAVTLNYGQFINVLVNFTIVAFAVFLLVRAVNRLKHAEAPAETTTKECPFCVSSIPVKATRCGHCTSDLKTVV